MVSAVVTLRDGGLDRVRIAVGACSPVARRLSGLEQSLAGKTAAQVSDIVTQYAFDELAPIDDVRADAGYRRDAVRTLVARTIAAAIEKETAHVA